MALKHLLNDRMRAEIEDAQLLGLDHPDANPSEICQEVVVNFLKEDAIRGEVYNSARFMSGASENFSIVDVHNVLDALIVSLEGGETDDPTGREEVRLDS